jgi:SAM-dependent methyltransferase
MAKAFPNSRFTGFDFSEEGVAVGRKEAEAMGITNSRFEVQDVANMEATQAFDFITAFDSIHDQAAPTQVLANISNALRPGGVFLMVDIAASSNLEENMDHPLAPMLYSASTMHCMTVSLALDGEGLGTAWGTQLAQRKLSEAGFRKVDIRNVEGDIMNAYYICTRD